MLSNTDIRKIINNDDLEGYKSAIKNNLIKQTSSSLSEVDIEIPRKLEYVWSTHERILTTAINNKSNKIAKYIIDHKDTKINYSRSSIQFETYIIPPLLSAYYYKNIEIIKHLLKREDLDVMVLNGESETIFEEAEQCGTSSTKKDILDLLKQHKSYISPL